MMKTRYMNGAVTAAILILTAGAGVSSAGERVPLEKVPPGVVKGIKDRYPKAEIRFVDKETNGNYEFGMTEGERQFEVGMAAGGKLVNVKEDISEEKLPAKIKDAVRKKFPGAKFVECEKVTTGEGKS